MYYIHRTELDEKGILEYSWLAVGGAAMVILSC